MAIVHKKGKVIQIGESAVYDFFLDFAVVDIVLEDEQGQQIKTKFNPDRFTPALGDTVDITWDYGHFVGKILAFATDQESSQSIFPLAQETTAYPTEIIEESLHPDGQQAQDKTDKILAVLRALAKD